MAYVLFSKINELFQLCVLGILSKFERPSKSTFLHLAITTVYLEEGNKEYRSKEASNAVYFYTQGIQVNCKDDVLNAKLYSNRATAHFCLGKILFHILHCVYKFCIQPVRLRAFRRS